MIQLTLTLKITTTQVVETSATVNNNSPIFRTTFTRTINLNLLLKGMDIKLARTDIRKQMGGSQFTSILSLGRALAPTLCDTLGLSAIAGVANEGASQLVKKISGGLIL